MREFGGEALFPTMVVGSLPRPRWVHDLVEDRKTGRTGEKEAERLLDSAIPWAIRMQERAGVDYVSDGEWRRDTYLNVFVDAVDGFQRDLIPPGPTSTSALPAVVSRLVPRKAIAFREASFLREHADARTMVAVPSPQTIGLKMWSPEHSEPAYRTAEELMEACIPIIRREIGDLARLGVDAVQIDDPWLASLGDPAYIEKEGITDVERLLDLSVAGVNGATEGIEGPLLSVHVCGHSPTSHGGYEGHYDLLFNALGRMNVDRLTMAFAGPDPRGFRVLADFPDDKVLGLGVVMPWESRVETPEEVMARGERALEFIPKERITLNPDCGFAPSARNRGDLDTVYLKLRAMCEGARLLREKYG